MGLPNATIPPPQLLTAVPTPVAKVCRFLCLYSGDEKSQVLRPVLRIRIHFIRIRIQHFRLNTYLDPIGIRIQGLNDQKLRGKKIKAEKKINFFGIKNYNLPIPRPP